MPRATVDTGNTVRVELKSAPPDGYVVLRRFSYGQKLERQQMSARMFMEADRKRKGGGRVEMDFTSSKVAMFEFQNCIVEHNLEDETGRQLNFSNPNDVVRLDPIVGEEIQTEIAKLNDFNPDSEEDDPEGNG